MKTPRDMTAPKCPVKDCNNETEGTDLCLVCCAEMETLFRDALRVRLGREPSSAEFDIFIDRMLDRAITRTDKVRP